MTRPTRSSLGHCTSLARRARALGWCWLILVLALPTLAAAAVDVPQGAVARWGGGAESCGMDGRTWRALEGVCWYPIDFARDPGTIEVARWLPGQPMESSWIRIVDVEFDDQAIDFPDESYVHLSEEDLARHYREQAEVKPLFRWPPGTPPRFTLPLQNPAGEPLPEGKYFAVNRSFNGESKNPHTGIDYAIGMDNPTFAVADGEVVLVGEHFFSGKSIYIDHGDGLISMYFHLNDYDVAVGDSVKAGDTIGKIGSSGRSTGPHLHLGLRWHRARIDPNRLLGELDVIDIE